MKRYIPGIAWWALFVVTTIRLATDPDWKEVMLTTIGLALVMQIVLGRIHD